jgi:acyl-ACP thioesterase
VTPPAREVPRSAREVSRPVREPVGAVSERFSAIVPYRIRFDEADPAGLLRTSGLLRYAQDSAWIHSERLGYDRAWYAGRGLWWLVRCIDLEVTGEIRMGETIDVTTEVVGYRKVWARRHTDFARSSGERVAGAVTDWVITDSRGLPTRVPDEFVALFGSVLQSFNPARVALPPTPDEATVRRLEVRPQDLDPMGHVNNAAYVDYLEESLIADPRLRGWPAGLPRRYRLEYVAAAAPEDVLLGSLWPSGEGMAYRLSTDTGAELLRATVRAGADASDGPAAWHGAASKPG